MIPPQPPGASLYIRAKPRFPVVNAKPSAMFRLKRQTARRADYDTVAAVDLGSNSFHMIVARLQGSELHVIDKLREMVRLAAGLDDENNLSDEAQQRALACLERFGQRLSAMPAGSVRAVGTNTLRSAHNSDAFIAAAEAALGHPIEIISGLEEARLIYLGVAQSTSGNTAQRLVIDIGGGSTECIIGSGFETRHLESLYMGCVSMSRRFFADGEITRKRWERAVLAAGQEVEPIQARYRRIGWESALGASGTIKAIQAVVREAGWTEAGITLNALDKLAVALIDAGHINKLSLNGLDNERAPVFPGGAAVLYALFKGLEIESMEVSEGALREGLLYDLFGRIRHEDVRDRSANSLAERYHVDLAQAQRVRETAWYCLAAVAEDWELGDDEEAKQFLGWAALLHEVGLDIAHSHYHKHGAYIIENSDMPGFSRLEQQCIAALVRVHRRKFATDAFDNLGANWRGTLARLAVLLRLSIVLHRSRVDTPLPEFELKTKNNALSLRFPEGWLDAHPLTQADIEQEADYLKGVRFKLNAH